MKNSKNKTFLKIAYLGLFLSISMILSYLESLLPVFPFAPGVKIGLANSFILLVLYLYGPKEAGLINLSRVLLSAFMFNGLYSLMYSLTGAVFSLLIMMIASRKPKVFSSVGTGMLGGLYHNLGQIAVAFFVTRVPGLIYYLPVLIVSGLLTGGIVGLLVRILLPPLQKLIRSESNE